MMADLTSHYAEKKPAATQVEEGGLYVVQEASQFHRCDTNRSRRFASLDWTRVTSTLMSIEKWTMTVFSCRQGEDPVCV